MPRNVIGDAVLVQTTTTGTGTYTLGNAIASHLTFAQAGIQSGERVCYTVVDSLTAPTQREVSEGVYTSGSPPTLTRALVQVTHTGGMSAINWGSGTKYLFVTPSAKRLPVLDTEGRLLSSVLPVIPTSRLLLSGATSVPNNVVTYVTYQLLVESSLAGAATVPTAGFTAPASGSGRLTLNALLSAGAGGATTRRALILRDGAIIAQAAAPPSAENHPFSLSWEGYVTAGQAFVAAVRQESGGTLQVTSSEFSLALTGG